MTTEGWILFSCANIFVLGLVGFCFYRVFSTPQEHMHSLTDIDTKDHDNRDS